MNELAVRFSKLLKRKQTNKIKQTNGASPVEKNFIS